MGVVVALLSRRKGFVFLLAVVVVVVVVVFVVVPVRLPPVRVELKLELLRVWWWKTRTPQLDLTDRAQDEIISLLDHGARAEIIQQAAS